jgi:hypothetical protein
MMKKLIPYSICLIIAISSGLNAMDKNKHNNEKITNEIERNAKQQQEADNKTSIDSNKKQPYVDINKTKTVVADIDIILGF